MEFQTYKYLSELETDKIKKYEQEIVNLRRPFVKQFPVGIDKRIKFLSDLIQESNISIADYEKNIGELKKFIEHYEN